MSAYIFIVLYGSSSLIGIFLAIFWSLMARHRRLAIDFPWYRDRYYIVAASVALITIGSVVEMGFRTLGNIQYGLSPILAGPDGYFIAFGLLVTLLGFFGLVWLADLEAQPPSWKWLRLMLMVAVIWGVASIFIAQFVPFMGVT